MVRAGGEDQRENSYEMMDDGKETDVDRREHLDVFELR